MIKNQDILVLKDGVLIDGTGDVPKDNMTLIINKNTIVDIGESRRLKIPTDARVIDIKGKTILPGFINAHVHNGYNEENLRHWATDGVTTVRDLILLSDKINPFAFKAKVNKIPELSRLVSAGLMISSPNGYPLDFVNPPFLSINNEVEAVEKVNWLVKEGADIVKIVIESGVLFGQKAPVLSVEQIRTIVKTAHDNGTLVSAHVTSSEDLKKALDGNVDDIAHMVGDIIPDELIDRMIKNDIYIEPTLELWKEGEKVLGLKTSVMINLQNYVLAGGKVALGTDYAGHPEFSFELGMPMREINWMYEVGMTPMQIIISCTKNAAYVCNLINYIGTLEVGKKADLLVVNGNPLEDLQVLKGDKLVIHDGKVIREFNKL